jgi:hypothetical protein
MVTTTAITLLLVIVSGLSGAQVPPHTPGTICFTPKSWCWAKPPGPPGKACACRTANGWVPGRLG